MTQRGRRWGVVVVLLVLLGAGAGAAFLLHPLWVSDQAIRYHLWGQGVRSEFLTLDGCRVHYFEAPAHALPGHQPGGQPLLLIHGLESRGEDWSGLIPTLAAQGFHVYAPDLLGYGRTCKPDSDYSMETQQRFVLRLMDSLGLTEPDVAGWSMGGWIAADLTLQHPERVHRLVLLDAAGIYFPTTFTADLFTPRNGAELAHLSSMLSPVQRPVPGFVVRAAVRKLQRDAWVIDRSVASMTSGHDLLDFRLHTISQPTLLVWGSQDRLIPLSVGQQMHRLIPQSDLLVIQGCGHLAPQECSKPVLKGMVRFLTAPNPPQGILQEVPGR